ncbi:lysophospholipase [Paracoccus halophilus]|uniref:Alpha/beta hydrolase n=1 Tax=Paracoccus halophilus TaxID=376733 RepID=A0A099F4J1_9RHOB|nr:alpha/beta hydrolase [Paracoccus halophilus]KGJ05042.1 alpha/beta hydrolase [Paracoccus halophilus]SFA39931.1 lysophospholipase [Paracoccus halophilus]
MTPAPFNTLAGDPVPRVRSFWLRAEDGIRLRVGHWAAADRFDGRAGSVLLFPGRTEYLEKYRDVAADLNDAGYDVLAIDWRGQGLSDRLQANPRPGHITDFADFQRDVVEMVVTAQELELPQPWHLLAHSMGGAIGLAALGSGLPVRSAAFSPPMWGIDLRGIPVALALALARLMCSLGRGGRPAPASGGEESFILQDSFLGNLLSSDGPRWGRIVAETASWPEIALGGATNDWLRAALVECRRLALLPSPKIPALVGLGGRDRIVSARAIRERVAKWPGARLLEMPDSRHEPMMERDSIRGAFLQAAVSHFHQQGGA